MLFSLVFRNLLKSTKKIYQLYPLSVEIKFQIFSVKRMSEKIGLINIYLLCYLKQGGILLMTECIKALFWSHDLTRDRNSEKKVIGKLMGIKMDG